MVLRTGLDGLRKGKVFFTVIIRTPDRQAHSPVTTPIMLSQRDYEYFNKT